MLNEHGIFQCVVISPAGRLLDCGTDSVILPAHDGKVGIWRNHMPMFCELGLGIMRIHRIHAGADRPPEDELMLVDGGVAIVNSNLLKVIAYDAVYLHELESQKAGHVIETIRKKLIGDMDGPTQRKHNMCKLALLDQLAQRSALSANIPVQAEQAEIFVR